MEALLIAGATVLAFSNGANDNFKGFATVWGSQTLSYRRALVLATLATVLGSLVSLILAGSLLAHFSGKGLVPAEVAGSPDFILSVGAGAAATVLLATRLGLPISTTHALIGGLLGAGLAHSGAGVNLAALVGVFLVPLLMSPFAAAALGGLACQLTRRVRIARTGAALDRLHVLSAASICFARGVNDTPKLTAVLIAAQAFEPYGAIALIAVTMAMGGLVFARRVARTMSQRMVRLDHASGLSANLVAAGLILGASHFGLPVSTTHVTVGSIAGVGVGGRSIDWRTTGNVLLSWLATLPLAAALAYAAAHLL